MEILPFRVSIRVCAARNALSAGLDRGLRNRRGTPQIW